MDYSELYDFFTSQKVGASQFLTADKEHILDINVGFDEYYRPTLAMVSDNKIEVDSKNTLILVESRQRTIDKKWSLNFILQNDKYIEMFTNLCLDLINSSRNVKENGALFLYDRFSMWRDMLTKLKDPTLSDNAVKGLLGELYFLKNVLAKKYGYKAALKSWIGQEQSKQDFVLDDSWYEIKSTSSGSESVIISSIEQLDTNYDGKLVILYLDKTSETYNERLSLNKYIDEIKKEISDNQLIDIFDGHLLSAGYFYSKKYDKLCFKYSGSNVYKVNDSFPCLRKNKTPASVSDVTYRLLISEIRNWREKNGIEGI